MFQLWTMSFCVSIQPFQILLFSLRFWPYSSKPVKRIIHITWKSYFIVMCQIKLSLVKIKDEYENSSCVIVKDSHKIIQDIALNNSQILFL